MRDQTFMTSLMLHVRSIYLLLIFVNERSGSMRVKKLVIFCGCHNFMITNVKIVMVLVMSSVYSETGILTL